MTQTTRVTRLHVLPEGEPLFSEQAFTVEIDDEAGGEFVVVRDRDGEIRLNAEEWPALREAIDRMVKECRE
jgi:hypothetical protein